jgi:hypothetical protein
MTSPRRTALALATLATALALGAPGVASAVDCIGCAEGEPAVNLAVSARLVPFDWGGQYAQGWSAVEIVITPQFPLLDPLPWHIPPTCVRVDVSVPSAAPLTAVGVASAETLVECTLASSPSVYNLGVRSFSSIGAGARPFTFWLGYLTAYPGFWASLTVTVDSTNEVAEFSEWDNVASIDVPLWPNLLVLEEWTGEPEVTYP